jgi:uridine kinase
MKIICIAGGSGSGKSTVAGLVYQKYKSNSVVLSLDDYYINEKQQIEINGYCNFDHPGAVDCKLLIQNINDLKEKGSTLVPRYSFKDRDRVGFVKVKNSDFLIIEGLHSIALLKGIFDVSIFIKSDLDLSLLRRINRDIADRGRSIERITEQYIKDVRPSYLMYIKGQELLSDIVIENNDSKIDLKLLVDQHLILQR